MNLSLMKKMVVLVFLQFLLISLGWAQSTVSGTVTNAETGEPLPGVAVVVKGTTIGQFTAENGSYALQVPPGSFDLLFTYVGRRTVEEPIEGRKTVDVLMAEDVFESEEVVITGFLSQPRKDLTGSISSIEGNSILDQPVITVQNALQGRAAGVQVVSNSGTPGSGIDVRIRGSSSITASNQPLYVLDGVPLLQGNLAQLDIGNASTNALADLNPNDIESIEVLKDAASAAIYGSRGGNGVVLITTRRGTRGKSTVSFTTSIGSQQPTNRISMANTTQYKAVLDEISQNRFGVPAIALGIEVDTLVTTNWQDQIFQQGRVSDNQLTISGGDFQTRYYVSLGYYQNLGIVKGSGFERYAGRINLTHRVSKRFSMTANLGYARTMADRLQNDNSIYGVVSTAVLLPPDIPIRDEDGSFGSAYGLESPVAAIEVYQNQAITDRVIGSITGKYELVSGLSFKAKLGIDLINFLEEVYEPVTLVSARGSNGYGLLGTRNLTRWVSDFTFNYEKAWDRATLAVVVGTGFQEEISKSSFIEATNFPSPDFPILDAAATNVGFGQGYSVNGLRSYFSNLNVAFDERYIVTATFRADGYSAFGVDNKFGYFPGISAAWRISKERYLAESNTVNDLKVRLSYGATGNNGIGNFDALPLVSAGANYLDQAGIAVSQLGNNALRWEQTRALDLGLDFTLLNYRLKGVIDFFDRRTTDLLFDRPLPTTSGFTFQTTNLGKVQNRGYELMLTSRNLVGAFKWTTSFNITRINNTILELYEDQPIDVGFASRIQVGESIGSFFGYRVDRLYQAEDFDENGELDPSLPTPDVAVVPGDIKWMDIDGDGMISPEDRTIIGSAQPDWIGGLTNTFTYKGISLDIFFQFSIGNEIYNNNRAFAEGLNSVFNQTVDAVNNHWTPARTITTIPRAVWDDPANNRRVSDRFLEDGSYLRLKMMTLAYDLPLGMLSNAGMSRLRIYLTCQNLLTITNYQWFDPEVNTFDGSNTALGTDFLTYPQARTILVGIMAGF